MRTLRGRRSSCKRLIEVLISILLFGGEAHFPAAQEHDNGDEMLLYKVVAAVEKATMFFGEDYASINVDGLFGIQVCQGSLIESINDCSRPEFNCPVDLTSRLMTIRDKLTEMTEKALPYIEQQDPEYYAQFVDVIARPYIVEYIPERLGDYVSPPGSDDSYNEPKGDVCYSKLLGTFSDSERTYPKCTVTDECWDYMTHRNAAAYYTTHQLIYFIVANEVGCLAEIEKYVHTVNATSVREIERRLCGKIYMEVVEESSGDGVDVLKQDLFLEQSVLCAILGFQEFITRKWVNLVLSWQTTKGCFTLPHQLVGIQDDLNQVADEQRQLLDLLYQEAKHIDDSRTRVHMRRQLLREQTMKGDCLAHKTGLAFGTLGTYIRHLINQIYNH